MKRRRITRSRGKGIPPVGAMRMARKCCVRSCEADVREARAKGFPLHKFPKEIGLRSRWLASGGFEASFKPSPGQIVCHRHFKRADYEAARGQKLLLRKGSVPSVFADYDNHPDPVIMSVKSSTSYAQEDLDLINSEILNLEQSISPLLSEARTPKSDSCGETCSSRPESSADSLNMTDSTEIVDNGFKTIPVKSETMAPAKQEINEHLELEVNTMAAQLGIVESDMTIKNIQKDLIIKEELKNIKIDDDKAFDKPEELKAKVLNRDGLKFFPGAKLEAKDFNDKWYSAKVVETDWDEREVLIHFDKWSSRFDEWIPMDSSRLRVLQTQSNEQTWDLPSLETKMKDFSVGERILATWADGRKYPAKVNAVLGNDRYDVLFDDGYAKTVKSSKMTKIATTSTKQTVQNEDYIGSKQERRDKKRKHIVMELFHTHSRKRSSKNEADKLLKKESLVVNGSGGGDCLPESKIDLDGTLFGPCYDPGTDLLRGFDTNISKTRPYAKRNKKEMFKNDVDQEEDVGPEWVDGEPQGVESYIVDGNDGPRRSIIVADKRLPPGWQKHFTQRKAGTSAGKWDVLFLHKSSGKKFRSRNDIRAFMENQGQSDFDPEKFDFCIHRKKKSHGPKMKQEVVTDTPKKIKTLLPKTKAIPLADTLLIPATSPVATIVPTPTTSIADGAVFIGGLRVEMEDSAYKCPKQGCNKTFRKENLLQMHIKHYHPEYSKFLGSTPNVADLAYARTIGESIEDIIPRKSNNVLEKYNKLGKKKTVQDKPLYAMSPTASNSAQPTSPTIAMSTVSEVEDEIDQLEQSNETQAEDVKVEKMSPISSRSVDMDDETEKKREETCAMSPGTLFDLKVREEKTPSGIKTLLPVRPTTSSEVQRIDRSKSLDEGIHIDKNKGQRKRQLSEYSSDVPSRGKRRHGMQEITDEREYGDLDESAVDAEGPTTLMYRYSRRKSDSRSDENSQSSQLNDSHLEKADPLKGDVTKRDTNIDGEENEGVMMMINGEMIKVEQLRREEIINCTCGYMEEDGLMIQCDLCLCWQHGHCNAIEKEKDVPEKYICYICQNPYRQRPSKKYIHDQDWIKEGKLPTLSNRTKNQYSLNQRTAMLKRSYDLVAALLQIQQVLHSLRIKINVAQKKDHPKLYLWAKNWDKIEIQKPDITPVPIIEITKASNDAADIVDDVSRRIEVKMETKFTLKEDPDEKSIASDSELMKILEEDNTMAEEAKLACKKEDSANQNKSHILLDALTKSPSPEGKYKTLTNSDTKTGNKDLLSNQTAEDDISTSTMTTHEMQDENGHDLSTPLQPFIPQPEAPIDPGECRMRLLEHIDHFQNHVDAKLTSIEAQVCALEAMDPEDIIPSQDVQPRTKQTIQMLLRDLNTVRKLAALC